MRFTAEREREENPASLAQADEGNEIDCTFSSDQSTKWVSWQGVKWLTQCKRLLGLPRMTWNHLWIRSNLRLLLAVPAFISRVLCTDKIRSCTLDCHRKQGLRCRMRCADQSLVRQMKQWTLKLNVWLWIYWFDEREQIHAINSQYDATNPCFNARKTSLPIRIIKDQSIIVRKKERKETVSYFFVSTRG